MIKLNRNKTSCQELLNIIDKEGGFPVIAEDFDGTKLCITIEQTPEGKPYCVLWQPGDVRGTMKTLFYADGKRETIFVKAD